jgi:hypothetical protein
MDYHIKPQEWEQIIAILRTRKDIKTKNESKLRRFIEGDMVYNSIWLSVALATKYLWYMEGCPYEV